MLTKRLDAYRMIGAKTSLCVLRLFRRNFEPNKIRTDNSPKRRVGGRLVRLAAFEQQERGKQEAVASCLQIKPIHLDRKYPM